MGSPRRSEGKRQVGRGAPGRSTFPLSVGGSLERSWGLGVSLCPARTEHLRRRPGQLGGPPPGAPGDGAGARGCEGAERELQGPAEPARRLPKHRGEVPSSPTKGRGESPGSWGCPRFFPRSPSRRAAAGRRRGGSGFAAAPSGTVPAPPVACPVMLEQDAIGPGERPPPHAPARGKRDGKGVPGTH